MLQLICISLSMAAVVTICLTERRSPRVHLDAGTAAPKTVVPGSVAAGDSAAAGHAGSGTVSLACGVTSVRSTRAGRPNTSVGRGFVVSNRSFDAVRG